MTPVSGECQIGDRCVSILISELSSHQCKISPWDERLSGEKWVSIWIGAVGPFSGLARRSMDETAVFSFDQEIDHRVLEHFSFTAFLSM